MMNATRNWELGVGNLELGIWNWKLPIDEGKFSFSGDVPETDLKSFQFISFIKYPDLNACMIF